MSPHSDTIFWFRANQSLLLLRNAAAYLAEKQHITICYVDHNNYKLFLQWLGGIHYKQWAGIYRLEFSWLLAIISHHPNPDVVLVVPVLFCCAHGRTINGSRPTMASPSAGIYQHIVYNEYLPIIVGKVYNYYGLRSSPRGHQTLYHPYLYPRTCNEFGAAAFRFGHSQVCLNLFLAWNTMISTPLNI
jgi:hypothetical protein